jgi:hypothetical protein
MRRILAAAALLLLGASARPYQYVTVGGGPQRWPSGQTALYVDAAMASDRSQAIRNASITWSSVTGSAFRYLWGGGSPSANVQDHSNGNNDCYFDSNLGPFGYAVTFAYESGSQIQDRDVAFNGAMTWTTNNSPSNAPDVETVALHELGHVLGLLHEDSRPAVMGSQGADGDPSIERHALLGDDEDGVRFLYPAGGAGGGGAAGPDIAAGTLQVLQGTPGPGQTVVLRAEVKNRSSTAATGFRVMATLSPALPVTAADADVGTVDVPSLAGGATTMVDVIADIPAGQPPGKYHLGVYADPENLQKDPVRENNGAALPLFSVTRSAALLSLGDAVDAGLGPQGTDDAEVWIGEGTEVRARVRGRRYIRPVLRVRAEGESDILAEDSGGRVASLRWTAPADGTYVLSVTNVAATVGRYRLDTPGRVRLRKAPFQAPVTVPFSGYEGGTVRALAVYDGDPEPLRCLPPRGAEITGPAAVRGGRARLGPFEAPETGGFGLAVDGEGPVLLALDARTPRQGTLVVR